MSTNQTIADVKLTTEMKNSYIDYAMSVIIGRALPDVRDGLKPVHRRILYAMHELGLFYDRPFRKSVRIVGDVLGKFHPHGDAAVYDAMVRMAQDFSTRYPTIKGHGNFGSLDGDGAAAMRYTEAKLNKIASEMLRDINKDTVNFNDNFDGSETEPEVLTARFPHLLVNGSSGIAVGMATNIPPHNLSEVIDATIAYLKNPNVSLDKLLSLMPGPDFPTGGVIIGKEGIYQSYETGRGKLKVRGVTEFNELSRGKSQIIITELAYLTNKAKLLERIAHLSNTKKIEGIADVRDESSLKDGIRVVLDLKRSANPKQILQKLYKYTDLETSFGVINLALVPDNTGKLHPRILPLKELLNEYVKFQEEIIIRRTKYDLKRAKDRAHILEGLLIAIDNIDEVVKIIRSSRKPATAKEKLKKRFKLDDIQAQAILDMRLARLTGLEKKKIKDELDELFKQIKKFELILADETEVKKVIISELREIKKNYKDLRRTKILEKEIEENSQQQFDFRKKSVNVNITKNGYISTLKKLKAGDELLFSFQIKSTSDLSLISNLGKAYLIKFSDIPKDLTTLKKLINLDADEKIVYAFPLETDSKEDIILLTNTGQIKKLSCSDLIAQTASGLKIITLKEDEVVSALTGENLKEALLISKKAYCLKIDLSQINKTTKVAQGIKGLNLHKEDQAFKIIIAKNFILVSPNEALFFKDKDIKSQKRGGYGSQLISPFDVIGASNFNKENSELIVYNRNSSQTLTLKQNSIKFNEPIKGCFIKNL